jgi:hypothetical protein
LGVLKKNNGYSKTIDVRATGIIEMERWLWENDASRNNKPRFHCTGNFKMDIT